MGIRFAERKSWLTVQMILSFFTILPICSVGCANLRTGPGAGSRTERLRATISPQLARVATDSEVQFVVKVAGEPVEPATWLVNGVPGGNDAWGTIVGGRYHSLIVDEDSMPACLEVAARTDDGTIMAVAHRSLPVVGLQFHPESILTDHGYSLLAGFLRLAALPVPSTLPEKEPCEWPKEQ